MRKRAANATSRISGASWAYAWNGHPGGGLGSEIGRLVRVRVDLLVAEDLDLARSPAGLVDRHDVDVDHPEAADVLEQIQPARAAMVSMALSALTRGEAVVRRFPASRHPAPAAARPTAPLAGSTPVGRSRWLA